MGYLSKMWKAQGSSTGQWPFTKQWLQDLFIGRQTHTGIPLSEDRALTFTAVYACVHIIAQTIATLPLNVYRTLPTGGKARAPDHSLHRVLHSVANPEMTSFSFRETLQGHLGLWGNAYAEKQFNGYGEVVALWPLRPDRTRPFRDPDTKELKYQTTFSNGETVTLPFKNVLHIPGFGFDGLVGYNPIDIAAQSISLGLAAEEFGARFFGNGAVVSGVLEHPGTLGEPGRKNVRQSFNEMHQGLSNAHRLMILEEGMKYQQIGIPPQTAQFLETRKFQITDIARFYHIPPHMIADLERSTNNNIEQQSLDFVKNTMLPWFTRWEQSMDMRLLNDTEQGRLFTKFMVNGLLRGDIKSRYEAYHIAKLDGWMNTDDIRELEDMNPIGGDVGTKYWMPTNYTYADQPTPKPSPKGGEPTK
ncbi:phage portal protein [Paenibacillus sp. EPM92]|uniref:phage portal protein n=1 Tax=Paenibacillus sp. EPM92 TaxID=1561195 RepID=UPI001915ED5D|nr:phage portal protein [Paenibacillus sp. EPM92]